MGVSFVDFQMGSNGQDVLVPLASGVRLEVYDIGLLEIICSRGFDPVPSSISCRRSSEGDWALLKPANGGIHTSFLRDKIKSFLSGA